MDPNNENAVAVDEGNRFLRVPRAPRKMRKVRLPTVKLPTCRSRVRLFPPLICPPAPRVYRKFRLVSLRRLFFPLAPAAPCVRSLLREMNNVVLNNDININNNIIDDNNNNNNNNDVNDNAVQDNPEAHELMVNVE